MASSSKTQITKDAAKKKITVVREFAAPVTQVWNAWTQSDLLDQWWAPKPWRAETKSMDFRPGGFWLYCMIGPDDTRMWSRVDFKTITPQKSFTSMDSFCDENGVMTNEFPAMDWKNDFYPAGDNTRVIVELSFASEADMNKIIEMGFEEGFTDAHGNLDELLMKQAVEQ